MGRNGVVLFLSLCWIGCAAPHPAAKPAFDLSKIRRISVVPFEGPEGRAITDEFVRQLVGAGLDVSDERHPGDVILTGVVTEYKPANKRIVFLGDTKLLDSAGQPVTVHNPVVSLGTSQVTAEGKAVGIPNAQVVSVNAVVSVIARFVNPATGNEIYANSYTYEGLDIQDVVRVVAQTVTRSLTRALPQMNKKAS